MSVSLITEDATWGTRSVLTEKETRPPVFVEKAIYNTLLPKQNAKVIFNGVVAVF